MEERKRPATNDHDDSGPPLKKQATAINGNSKAHVDADMPWKDDLERFQKEAIWRQMQEHKRERNSIEARLNSAEQRAQYHDEHIMVIDAWFGELLDEVKLIAGDSENHRTFQPFPSALLSSDTDTFKKHLKSRSSEISSTISKLFAGSSISPETSDLQARISQLLVVEKSHIVELERSRQEKAKLEERLEDAALRYMIAEKKLDRSKSATVAKLEKQAISGGRSDAGSGLGGGKDLGNAQSQDGGPSNEELAEALAAKKEALATASKKKEQLEALEAANAKLTQQLTTSNNRLHELSDDDYSKSDLYKQLRSQHEDVMKRVNDLEATNIQLREEAERLRAERSAYKVQMEQESKVAVGERERQLAQAENDLARVRLNRDELAADVAVRKATQGQEKASVEEAKELLSAKEERIKVLESEIARLKSDSAERTDQPSPANVEGLSLEKIKSQYSALEKNHTMLNTELQSMGTAFNKASKAASQRVANMSAMEDKVQRLMAEKAKADQKYFAAMKAKEAREQEVRTLRAQNAKSSEMVSSLKDSESSTRALQIVSEKHIAEAKESILNISAKLRLEQQALNERNHQIESLKSLSEEYKKQIAAKDETASTESSLHRQVQAELESLKVRLEETKKSLESWKAKGLGNQSSEYEMLRHLAICTVCRANFKDTALKTCGHVFCKECVDERTTSRSRKCPNCNRSFGTGDVMRVTL